MSNEKLIEFKSAGRITVGTIHSASVLDALNVTEFGKEAVEYVRKHRNVHLLMNFEHVGYLSSAVLTELLRIKEAAEQTRGGLRLCAVNADIRKVFEITNLDKVFVLYDEKDEAVHRYERSLDIEEQEKAWMTDDD